MAEKLTPTLDCTSCGACCVEAGSVTVYPEDSVPMRHTRSVRGRMGYLSDDYLDGIREMKVEEPGTRCACLRGTVGVEVRCAIYARRSRVCREFDVGSEGCSAARTAMERKRASPEYGPRGYEVRPPAGRAHPAAATA